MMKKIIGFSIPALALTPFIASAQGLQGLIGSIYGLINNLIPVVIGLAVLLFLWGVLRYLFSKEDTEKGAAKTYMLWGIITLFVMVSVWGLVNILSETLLGTDAGIYQPPATPGLPRPR